MFPNTRAFAFTRQPMKRNFTWSTRTIHLSSSSAFLCQLKFWFAKKLKMSLRIAPTDTNFCKYPDHAKILIVFKRWCNCLILCEIISQFEILRESSVLKSAFKRKILPHYQNSRFFRTCTSSNKRSGPFNVRINSFMTGVVVI